MVAPQFSWDQFLQDNKVTSQQPQEQPQPNQGEPPPQGEPEQDQDLEPKSFSWGQFQTNSSYDVAQDPEQEESGMEWLTRNVVSNVARIGEQAAGAYGNLYRLGQDALYKFPKAAGPFGTAIHEWLGDDVWKRLIYGQEGLPSPIKPPESKEIKKATEGLTGEYTKPKTAAEAKVQELSEDIGSTAITGRPASARNLLVNNFGIPAAANAVEAAVDHLGFGKDKATVAKLGTWMALSLSGNVNGRKEAARMVNEGRNALPDYLRADVPRYEKRLNDIERTMLHADPRSALAREQITGMRTDINNGQLSVQELMNRYDSINAAKNSRGLFELGHAERNAARKNIDRVLHTVRDEIMEVGKAHPEALKQWREGMKAYSVIHQSQRMTKWMDSMARGPYGKIFGPAATALFGVGSYSSPAAVGVGAVSAPLAYKGYQIGHRVWNDPNLAKYYWGAVSAAAAENTNAFVQNIKKLEEGYEKKSKKDKKSSPVAKNSPPNTNSKSK